MRAIDIEFDLNGGVEFFNIPVPDLSQVRIVKFSVNLEELAKTQEKIVESIRNKAMELADGSEIHTYAVTPMKGKLDVFIEVAKGSEYGPTER
jgi:hypothetical protein